MDFELNEEQKILQKAARDFLRKECPKELVRRVVEGGETHAPELWRKMADLGWMGLLLPEAHGGTDGSFVHMAVLLEEMGYHLCPEPFISTTLLGSVPVLLAGTDEQKSEILPAVIRGDRILTLALSEPDGGWEPAALNVRAERAGGAWVINGSKLFVPDAGAADHILCVARTGEGAYPQGGLTLFLVPRDEPGVTVTALRTVSKEKQYEVFFDQVRVGTQSVIGTVNEAWPVVTAALERAAAARCADTVGAMRATLDMTLAYARERVQFGRPIGSYQAIQHYLADMWVDLLGTRNLVFQAAWKLSTGQPADREVSMAKVRAGEAGRKATTVGHRVFGAISFTMEHDLHLYHRRTLAADLSFGDADLHHERVARSLGM